MTLIVEFVVSTQALSLACTYRSLNCTHDVSKSARTSLVVLTQQQHVLSQYHDSLRFKGSTYLSVKFPYFALNI